MELNNPISRLSGSAPIKKQSEHYFFQLPHYAEMLEEWTKKQHLQPEVANKLQEWLKGGLQPWDISRDSPYFGFKIPGTEDKYFYVWLDAPIGYMASFKKLCKQREDLDFADYWHPHSQTELYHFIGKDIINFHGLFWPAMLKGSGFRSPTAIFTHGFLTIDGKKMSKSRGTLISARDYLTHLDEEYLRYYFAAKLNAHSEDIDLNLNDFTTRINADLVGKVVNIASRCAGFINKHFELTLSSHLDNEALLNSIAQQQTVIAELYEGRQFSHVVRKIMALADEVNHYIAEKQPWKLIKEVSADKQQVQAICTTALNALRQLMIYLKPILPKMAANTEAFLNCAPLMWQDIDHPLLNHQIRPFKTLMKRIEAKHIEALQQAADNNDSSTQIK
jgi:methionyl-tRNA synthetase